MAVIEGGGCDIGANFQPETETDLSTPERRSNEWLKKQVR